MDQGSQYKTALSLAKRALDYIARYGTPPTPHAYEIFYTVCAGQNAELNEALAEVIADKRQVSARDAERLYEKFLSTDKTTAEMASIGSNMSTEMSGLLTLIDTVSNSTNTYQSSLQKAEQRLASGQPEQNIEAMVQSLLEATQSMARSNAEVSANLETSRAQVEQLEDCLKAAREESSRDPLTGLCNRRQFDIMLDEAILAAGNENTPLSLLMVDIDHFKPFNDEHGHVAGDSALRYVASCLKSNIKEHDTAARYGGEEFVVILSHTSVEHAMSVAERIRHLINSRHLVKKATGESMGRISVSIGVTERQAKDSAESFLHRADMCMYAAKTGGRNRVQHTPVEPSSDQSADQNSDQPEDQLSDQPEEQLSEQPEEQLSEQPIAIAGHMSG